MEIKQFGVADLGRLDKNWGGLDMLGQLCGNFLALFCQRLDSSVTIFQRDFGQLCAHFAA